MRPFFRRFARITTSGAFIPEVDGLRFVALAAVVVWHVDAQAVTLAGDDSERCGSTWLAQILCRGQYGVELFFAISGFILGLPFARHAITGSQRVALGRYFRRRLTRLEPPYLITLFIYFLGELIVRSGRARDLLPDLVASCCYLNGLVHNAESKINGVSWSLEIEVQFYLLAPLLAAVFSITGVFRRRACLIVAVALGSLLQHEIPTESVLRFTLFNFLSFFGVGFLFADLYIERESTSVNPSVLWDVIGVAALAAVVPVSTDAWAEPLLCPWLILIFVVAAFRGSFLRRSLRLPIVGTIGGMCYSIYLLHLPFILIASRLVPLTGPFSLRVLELFAVATPLILICAGAFFILVERPCMNPAWPEQLRARMARL